MSEKLPEELKFQINLRHLLSIVNRIVTPQYGFLDKDEKKYIPSADIFDAATVRYKKVKDKYDEDLRQATSIITDDDHIQMDHSALVNYYILRWTEDIRDNTRSLKINS